MLKELQKSAKYLKGTVITVTKPDRAPIMILDQLTAGVYPLLNNFVYKRY